MPHKIPTHRFRYPSGIPLFRPKVEESEQSAEKRRLYENTPERRSDIQFYQSKDWARLRAIKLRMDPQCERCGAIATHVHHVIERKQAPHLALDFDNLEALCVPCHTIHHKSRQRKRHR